MKNREIKFHLKERHKDIRIYKVGLLSKIIIFDCFYFLVENTMITIIIIATSNKPDPIKHTFIFIFLKKNKQNIIQSFLQKEKN